MPACEGGVLQRQRMEDHRLDPAGREEIPLWTSLGLCDHQESGDHREYGTCGSDKVPDS